MTQPPIPMAQEALWRHKVGNDGDDDVFALPQAIKCRLIFKSRNVRTKEGDEIRCIALMACEEAVVQGDVIAYQGRNYPVLGTVEELPDMDGKVWWREVAL